MEEKTLDKLDKHLARLDKIDFKRLENLNIYLEQNGGIVIDLMMRIAALESIIVEKGMCSDEELRKAIDESYGKLKTLSDAGITGDALGTTKEVPDGN